MREAKRIQEQQQVFDSTYEGLKQTTPPPQEPAPMPVFDSTYEGLKLSAAMRRAS